MMMPGIFGEDLFDEMMNFPFETGFLGKNNPLYGKRTKNLMKTDVKETDASYMVDIDLPGFKKNEVSATLENGYLTINAVKDLDKSEKDKEGKYIRKERYTGQCTRSFYVGEGLKEEEIHAKFEDGILKLTVPKKEPQEVESKKYISIEG